MEKRFRHIPLIPLSLDEKDLAIKNELIVDYNTNNIYITNKNNEVQDDLITAMQKRLEDDRRHEILSPDQRKVYGVDIDLTEDDPTLTARYAEDATGFKNFYIDQTTGEIEYGTWKDIIKDFFEPTPVLMENGEEVLRLNPNDYNKILDEDYDKKSIFGMEIDIATGKITYTDDAIGYQPVVVSKGKRKYGTWKDFLIKFIGLKPTVESEIYDLDPNHYNVKTSQDRIGNDNIFIRYYHNYYYISLTSEKLIFRIANYKVNDDFIDEIFIDEKPFYVGAYEGSLNEGILESKSGKDINANDTDLGLNNMLLGKRYMYIFCIAVMISKSVEMENLGCYWVPRYDNIEGEPNKDFNPYGYSYGIYRKDYQDVVQQPVTGAADHDGFFSRDEQFVKSMGSENLLGNGGFISNGIYADGGKLILDIPDDTDENSTININKVIYLENRLLNYKNKSGNIDLAFTSNTDAVFYVSMPARLII